jgi:iron-sulfur cluster repair protein YtfE (RIC family)
MNALELLRTQHSEIERLFLRAATVPAARKKPYLDALAESLTVHTALEETIFYPACTRIGLEPLLRTAVEEHERILRDLRALIAAGDYGTAAFEPALDAIANDLARHVASEEGDLFPEVGRLLPDDLGTLGQLLARTETALEEEYDEDLARAERRAAHEGTPAPV